MPGSRHARLLMAVSHVYGATKTAVRSVAPKKLDFTAVRCLVRLKTVLYGHGRSLYGIVPCFTAPSHIILCSE